MPPRLEIIGIQGLPEVCPGDNLAQLTLAALSEQSLELRSHDILVISQKIVSKAEGRLVRLEGVLPSPMSMPAAQALGRDPHLIEVILQETRRIVRMDQGILITETKQGMICANAGVDQSNVDAGMVSLLPEDPDRSAKQLRQELKRLTGLFVGVIISDTFGRPWREGLTNVA